MAANVKSRLHVDAASCRRARRRPGNGRWRVATVVARPRAI